MQEFAHPQARFLHEKQRALSPRSRRWLAGLLAAVNRASFKAIDGAMFVGTVRPCCCRSAADYGSGKSWAWAGERSSCTPSLK